MLLLTFKSVVCSFFLVFCSCFLFCFFLFYIFFFFFFFQAEDGIRDADVTGVQTCALPISASCRIKSKLIHYMINTNMVFLMDYLRQLNRLYYSLLKLYDIPNVGQLI